MALWISKKGLGSKAGFLAIVFGCLMIIAVTGVPAQAESLSLSDSELEGVSAKGSISLGSYTFNDNHQFDASQNKGGINMDGSAMMEASSMSIILSTQSAVASGVNVIGDITTSSGGTFNFINSNEATNFVGGF